jgi:hypothetical protein
VLLAGALVMRRGQTVGSSRCRRASAGGERRRTAYYRCEEAASEGVQQERVSGGQARREWMQMYCAGNWQVRTAGWLISRDGVLGRRASTQARSRDLSHSSGQRGAGRI